MFITDERNAVLGETMLSRVCHVYVSIRYDLKTQKVRHVHDLPPIPRDNISKWS